MAQLTGRQTGTPQDDTFIGTISEAEITSGAEEEVGILNATINTLKGEDRIEGSALADASINQIGAPAIGISQSTIDAGISNDTIVGDGFGFGTDNALIDDLTGIAEGIGALRSSIRGNDGEDSISFSGRATGGEDLTGAGIRSSSIDGGGGKDTIAVSAETGVVRLSFAKAIATTTGAENSLITGGGQQDSIQITANADAINNIPFDRDRESDAVVTGILSSFVSGDGGDDTISISAEGRASTSAEVSAVSGSEVRGAAGNDVIDIISSAPGFRPGKSVAVEAKSTISGDAGDDTISISASSTSTAPGFGVANSTVEGGNGTDTIAISSDAITFTGEAFGAIDSVVDGGNDNDAISISATLSPLSSSGGEVASGAAANRSTIKGGSGDDTLFFEVNSFVDGNGQDITGLKDSEVYGNSGNDTLTVNASGSANYNIIDSQLFGGAGNDLFDIGIGDGRLIGGADNDTAILDYLNAQATTITAINNGIRISGTQTNTGEEGEWTQDILGVESYLVDGTTYTNDTLLQAFG